MAEISERTQLLKLAASKLVHSLVDHPVAWYPWGVEPFHQARQENKPVFVCVAKTGDERCREMLDETLSDPVVADSLNKNFVSVFVDCDEEPQVELVFAEVVRLIAPRSVDKPLSIFLTPEGTPFFGGTYFPQTGRFGTPSFASVCSAVLGLFMDQKDDVGRRGESLIQSIKADVRENSLRHLEEQWNDSSLTVNKVCEFLAPVVERLDESLAQRMDRENGGFVSLPKGFGASALLALMESSDPKKAATALFTLEKIRTSALADPVHGGVFSGSEDRRWMQPRFEKNLLDNVQLMALYAQASVVLRESQPEKHHEFVATVKDIFDFMEENLRCSQTGLYQMCQVAESLDDSLSYFGFGYDEFAQVFSDDARLRDFALGYFKISRNGNAHGTNILSRPESLRVFCSERNIELESGERLRDDCVQRLREVSKGRIKPASDGKMTLSSNALAVSCFLRAGEAINDARYSERALKILDTLWDTFVREREIPARIQMEDRVSGAAHADDLAFLLNACVDAYCRFGDHHHAVCARQVCKWLHAVCVEPAIGTLFFSRDDSLLFTRPFRCLDDVTPSPPAVVYSACQRFLSLIVEGQRTEDLEPSDVKMWEALQLVALATLTQKAQNMPHLCASALLAVRQAGSLK